MLWYAFCHYYSIDISLIWVDECTLVLFNLHQAIIICDLVVDGQLSLYVLTKCLYQIMFENIFILQNGIGVLLG